MKRAPLPRMVRTNANRPCPACKRSDWCLISPDGKACICSRVESRKRCGDAGWLHKLDEPLAEFTPEPEKKRVYQTDWYLVAQKNAEAMTPELRQTLADKLRLPADVLKHLALLGVYQDTYTFPERDGRGRVIGLNRRFPDGRKLHLAGGGRGLTLPNHWQAKTSHLYCVEGPTDTLAMVAAGLNAIGRPSNRGGSHFLAEAINEHTDPDTQIVIVGENDRRWNEKFDRYEWPGLVGCVSVAGELSKLISHEVLWALPPTDYKDVREYLTGEQFENTDWETRGAELAADMVMHPAYHQPEGYSGYAKIIDREIGYDPNDWRE